MRWRTIFLQPYGTAQARLRAIRSFSCMSRLNGGREDASAQAVHWALTSAFADSNVFAMLPQPAVVDIVQT